METPAGSRIKFIQLPNGTQKLFWSNNPSSLFRYSLALFFTSIVLFVGFKIIEITSMLHQLDQTNRPFQVGLMMFLIAALFMLYIVFQLLKPSRPESIELKHDLFSYDQGSAFPLKDLMKAQYNNYEALKILFKKSYRKSNLSKADLKLVYEKNPSRIYFDDNLNRIIIGKNLSEPEIDWLATQLQAWSK